VNSLDCRTREITLDVRDAQPDRGGADSCPAGARGQAGWTRFLGHMPFGDSLAGDTRTPAGMPLAHAKRDASHNWTAANGNFVRPVVFHTPVSRHTSALGLQHGDVARRTDSPRDITRRLQNGVRKIR